MTEKHWCVMDGAPVRTEPGTGVKLMSLPKFALVEVLETKTALYNKVPTTFHRIFRPEGTRQATEGWVYAGYLERYHGHEAHTKIKTPTVNPNDAAQYLVWDGMVQFNLCGFFCIAQCTGWDGQIEEMLNYLKELNPSFVSRVFSKANRGLTSSDDLSHILSTLGHETPFKIAAILKDRVTGTILNTPGRMANILSSYRVIYGVKINTRSGRVSRSGTPHWIVLNDINLMDFGGIVEVYNPFGDRHEAYEWDQIVESGGVPSGVMVPR